MPSAGIVPFGMEREDNKAKERVREFGESAAKKETHDKLCEVTVAHHGSFSPLPKSETTMSARLERQRQRRERLAVINPKEP